jgi:hypothetical protein
MFNLVTQFKFVSVNFIFNANCQNELHDMNNESNEWQFGHIWSKWSARSRSLNRNLAEIHFVYWKTIPSTAFGHSDQKKRALNGRQLWRVFCDAFCKTFIQLLSVTVWVTVIAFSDFFRKYFEISLKGFLWPL